ncbi:L,D-transpeptidase family protein [Ochrobactrum sp. Marseille-Q0166]|nr:L,D-transpeptidase family protein [Ochrobactrum sp. Marseille-Q0166]
MDLLIKKVDDNLWNAQFGEKTWRCAVGRGGIQKQKQEGDGVSPIGRWPLRRLFYRADRISKPETVIACRKMTELDGWCDDPSSAAYNMHVTLPFAARHEVFWMDDDIYDCVVVLGHNDNPIIPGAGSAIFLHIARPDYTPTAGCAALNKDDLLEFLKLADKDTHLQFLDES